MTAVIGGDDDQGVLFQAGADDGVDEDPQAVVRGFDARDLFVGHPAAGVPAGVGIREVHELEARALGDQIGGRLLRRLWGRDTQGGQKGRSRLA